MSEEELREKFSVRLDELTHAREYQKAIWKKYGTDPANPKVAGAAKYVERAQAAYDEIAAQI